MSVTEYWRFSWWQLIQYQSHLYIGHQHLRLSPKSITQHRWCDFRDSKSVKVSRVKFTESRRPFSRTHQSLEDYRICYTAIEESKWDILPSEFCQRRNWFHFFQKKKREDQLNSQWKSLFHFNISGRTKRSTSLPEEMFCRMPCQRVPVWITEKRLLQILGHPPGRYFIKENIFFGGKSSLILFGFGPGFDFRPRFLVHKSRTWLND